MRTGQRMKKAFAFRRRAMPAAASALIHDYSTARPAGNAQLSGFVFVVVRTKLRLENLRPCEKAKTLVVKGKMSSTRSSLLSALICAVFVALPTQATLAQQAPAATTVRTVLALTSLPSVVDAPLFFKLSKAELAAGQTTKYFGPVGFIYVLSGSLAVDTHAGRHSLKKDDAFLVAAASTHSLSVSGSEPALFLHYVLARSTELDQAVEQPPAVVTELYRTPGPIPDLKPGRYEFTLTRVSYPRMLPNVPHYRSGAALYYVRSGSGIFIADGKTETKETGTPHFEPHGWLHQWANSGDVPLVLLQANISEEGVPAVITAQPPPLGPGR